MTDPSDEHAAQRSKRIEIEERPITGADLRALITQEGVLRGSYVMPSASALEELAKAVSVLRGRIRVGTDASLTPDQRLDDDRKKCASEALEMLARVLPGLRDGILSGPDCGSPEISELMRLRNLSQLDALQNIVSEAWEYGWLIPHQELSIQVVVGSPWATQHSDAYAAPAPSPDREIHKWHDFAVLLAEKFRDVVQATNPGLPRLRNGNGEDPNPVVRFLVAVIPHVTGEEPQPSAVRKWLQRNPGGDKPI